MKGLLFGSRRSLGLGGLVGTAALALPSIWGANVSPTEVDVLDGIAWLANETSGAVVRINGETGKVDAKVGFEESQGILGVNQNGSTVLVQVGDQVHSIDVAALDWGGTTAASDQLVVGDGAAYLVADDGAVAALDPVTLATLGELSLGDEVAGAATTIGRQLVVPLADGTVAVVDGDEITATAEVGDAGDSVYVTAVGKGVVVLNTSAGRVYRLDPRQGKLRGPVDVDAGVPDGDLVVPQRLTPGRLWLLAPDSGELVGIAPKTGKVVTVKVAEAGHELVGPVVDDGNVYLVDRSAKAIVQVPVNTMKPESHKLELDDAGRVDVIAEGGKVFVNDPTSALAVVIDGDNYRNVDKYDDEGVATATPPNTKTPPPPREEPEGPQAPAGPPEQPPATPREVVAQAGNESATVSWAPGAGGGVATSFFVSYDGGDTVEVPGNRLSTPIEGLENGEEYVFEVWAGNEFGESGRVPSNPVVPNDRVPGTPEGVQATAADGSAHVTWTAASARGRDITRYVITSAPDGIVAEAAGNATQADITGLTNGTTYTFTVTAVNDLDVQGPPSAASNPVRPYGAPGAIPGANIAADDGTITIDWEPAPNLSDQAVQYAVSVEGGETQQTGETAATFGGLQNGVDYNILITPSNDRGAGPTYTAAANPSRAPVINALNVTQTGDRQFQVSVDFNDGGRPATCTLAGYASCNTTVDVATYFTDVAFNASVTTERGTVTANRTERTASKPMNIRGDSNQFDGWCTWLAGHPNVAAYFAEGPDYRCPNRGHDATGYLPLGSAVRAQCYVPNGEEVHDDSEIGMTTWVRLDTYGWMPGIYFSRDVGTVQAGLNRC